MKHKIIILVFWLLSLYSANGAITGYIEATGKVIKYNKKTVTIEQAKGGRREIPRALIPKHFKIKTGNIVTAYLPGNSK